MHNKPHTEETREALSVFWTGRPKPWLKGRKFSEEHRKKLSEAKKGKTSWNRGIPMWWTPSRMKGKVSPFKGVRGVRKHTLETRYKISQAQPKGESHHAWKGGITPRNRTIRNSIEMKLWRESVFARDNWTCTWCGARNGNGITVVLHADHIKQFAYYPELRFSIDNGRTLCKPCHKKTDSFSRKI